MVMSGLLVISARFSYIVRLFFAFSASAREGQKQGMLSIRFRTLCLIKNFFDYNTVRLMGLGKGPGSFFSVGKGGNENGR